ncbi:sigma-70 region 4 domain-containing protein [Hymenobacter sp. H14-R3]|uniref:RNA polymerase sigma factor n=1 Tax=Hymenobacter sp. H14-R3 TaxID=3046308 RepID=UPI0032D91EC4
MLNLYAIEGYSHPEIAQLLGIAEGTSKSQLARARQLLARRLHLAQSKLCQPWRKLLKTPTTPATRCWPRCGSAWATTARPRHPVRGRASGSACPPLRSRGGGARGPCCSCWSCYLL